MLLLDKKLLRSEYLRFRKFHKKNSFDDKQILEYTLRILTKKANIDRVIGIYSPLETEPNLTYIENIYPKVAYPKIKNNEMYFIVPSKLATNNWEPNAFGILEPQIGRFVIPYALLIPGLVFDSTCNRIGFGAGFYDKYIAKHGKKLALKIGVCYDYQILGIDKIIKVEEHDQKMDYVVSQHSVLYFS